MSARSGTLIGYTRGHRNWLTPHPGHRGAGEPRWLRLHNAFAHPHGDVQEAVVKRESRSNWIVALTGTGGD